MCTSCMCFQAELKFSVTLSIGVQYCRLNLQQTQLMDDNMSRNHTETTVAEDECPHHTDCASQDFWFNLRNVLEHGVLCSISCAVESVPRSVGLHTNIPLSMQVQQISCGRSHSAILLDNGEGNFVMLLGKQ